MHIPQSTGTQGLIQGSQERRGSICGESEWSCVPGHKHRDDAMYVTTWSCERGLAHFNFEVAGGDIHSETCEWEISLQNLPSTRPFWGQCHQQEDPGTRHWRAQSSHQVQGSLTPSACPAWFSPARVEELSHMQISRGPESRNLPRLNKQGILLFVLTDNSVQIPGLGMGVETHFPVDSCPR